MISSNLLIYIIFFNSVWFVMSIVSDTNLEQKINSSVFELSCNYFQLGLLPLFTKSFKLFYQVSIPITKITEFCQMLKENVTCQKTPKLIYLAENLTKFLCSFFSPISHFNCHPVTRLWSRNNLTIEFFFVIIWYLR